LVSNFTLLKKRKTTEQISLLAQENSGRLKGRKKK